MVDEFRARARYGEAFWRAHHEAWKHSDLNQREYCELHGLPLKRFGNWRAKLRHEEPASAGKLLYRRGGGLRHMSRHVSSKETVLAPATYIPSASATPPNGRRQFSKADKKRLLAEIDRPGGSVSGVAKRYGISVPLLFRWKRELAASPRTTLLPGTGIVLAGTFGPGLRTASSCPLGLWMRPWTKRNFPKTVGTRTKG